MSDASKVIIDPNDAVLPELHAIRTRAADLTNTSPSERTVALGGIAAPKIPSFSVSTRLRNRDVIESRISFLA